MIHKNFKNVVILFAWSTVYARCNGQTQVRLTRLLRELATYIYMRGVIQLMDAEVRNKVLVCPTLHLGGYQYKCADTVDPRT